MRRGPKILIGLVVVLAVLLAVNTVVTDSETKPAGVNAPGGEIVELSTADLQIVDQPATGPGPEGATIVMLHCYACSLRWWDEIVPLLNERHRIVRFDLIGFGGSQKPGSGYAISDQARAVSEAMNSMGIEGAVIAGHSLGGLVAAQIAQDSSQLVDRVAVLGTANSIGQDAELPFLARLSYFPVLGQAIWRLRPSGMVKNEYESAFAPGFDYEAAFEDPDQVLVDNEAMTFTSYKEASAEGEDFTDESTVAARMTESAVPLLAILGAEDQIVDTEATQAAYEGVPGAIVEVLGGVGHTPQLEAPGKTAALLEDFAQDAPPPFEPPPEPQGGPQGPGQGAGGARQGGADAQGSGGAGQGGADAQGSGAQGADRPQGQGSEGGDRGGAGQGPGSGGSNPG